MATVAERLAAARERLEQAGLAPADARLDAEVLARHALGWDRTRLLVQAREEEPAGFDRTFDELIARRAAREPVSQITGIREFWGRDFEVSRHVLTPRPETELIVEEALAFAAERPCRNLIDLGTGSGCLAITLALARPDLRVCAVDISADALAVARRNAIRHGASDRVRLIQADLFQPLTLRADLIVSNPPYVPDADADLLQPEVVRYEPAVALFGGPGGLDVVHRMFDTAADNLAPAGRLIVEFGLGQASAITTLAHKTGWHVVRVRNDLQGIPRTLVLERSRP